MVSGLGRWCSAGPAQWGRQAAVVMPEPGPVLVEMPA